MVLARLLLSAGALVVWFAPAAAGAAGPAPDSISLINQSPWVSSGAYFSIGLGVTPGSPGESLQLSIFPRLSSRSSFDVAANGQVSGQAVWRSAVMPLTSLASDATGPNGAVELAIPIDQTPTARTLQSFNPATDAAGDVYPLQAQLYSTAGAPVGQPLTTFLVYATTPLVFTKLSVSLTVPVATDSTPQVDTAATIVALQNYHQVPVTLDVSPSGLAALNGDGATGHAALTDLAQLLTSGDELLPSTYAEVSPAALEAASLDGEVRAQVSSGDVELAALLHRSPDTGTWVMDQQLDPAALATLTDLGLQQLVLPASQLSALPSADQVTTFAQPTGLVGRSSPRIEVVGADEELSARFDEAGGAVLSAQNLLAELSMIQLETPGIARGVAILPPVGWQADPNFLSTLLSGLQGNPLLSAVTASGLFAAVPAAGPTASPLTRSLDAKAATPLSEASQVRKDRLALGGLGEVVPQDHTLVATLGTQLLGAESAGLAPGARQSALNSVQTGVARVERQITLPGEASVTLTARAGVVPLTLLSQPSLRAHVSLRLSAQKLSFHRFTPAAGTCQVADLTTEVCQLTLSSQSTTLQIPVEARTSGVFSLDVELASPDGTVVLASAHDVVRSTAVSYVGIALIVAAGLFLAVWWIRDIHHGRRARKLVVPPGDDDPDPLEPVEALDEGPHFVWVDETDALIAEFFATPAPSYPQRSAASKP